MKLARIAERHRQKPLRAALSKANSKCDLIFESLGDRSERLSEAIEKPLRAQDMQFEIAGQNPCRNK